MKHNHIPFYVNEIDIIDLHDNNKINVDAVRKIVEDAFVKACQACESEDLWFVKRVKVNISYDIIDYYVHDFFATEVKYRRHFKVSDDHKLNNWKYEVEISSDPDKDPVEIYYQYVVKDKDGKYKWVRDTFGGFGVPENRKLTLTLNENAKYELARYKNYGLDKYAIIPKN